MLNIRLISLYNILLTKLYKLQLTFVFIVLELFKCYKLRYTFIFVNLYITCFILDKGFIAFKYLNLFSF